MPTQIETVKSGSSDPIKSEENGNTTSGLKRTQSPSTKINENCKIFLTGLSTAPMSKSTSMCTSDNVIYSYVHACGCGGHNETN